MARALTPCAAAMAAEIVLICLCLQHFECTWKLRCAVLAEETRIALECHKITKSSIVHLSLLKQNGWGTYVRKSWALRLEYSNLLKPKTRKPKQKTTYNKNIKNWNSRLGLKQPKLITTADSESIAVDSETEPAWISDCEKSCGFCGMLSSRS